MKKLYLMSLILLNCTAIVYGAADQAIWERVRNEPKSSLYFTLWKPEDYQEAEEKLHEMKEKIDNSAIKYLAGGLTSTMTPEDIKSSLLDRFCRYYREGKIITPEAFERIKDQYTGPAGGHTNLTRIWGGEYLKTEFQYDDKLDLFDVPDFVIVTPDPKKITIRVSMEYMPFRFPAAFLLKNGGIYFKTIKGEPDFNGNLLGAENRQYLQNIAFADFGFGNVRFNTDEKKYYVVDTELKSFDEKQIIPDYADKEEYKALYYAGEKLKLLLKDENNGARENIVELDLNTCPEQSK